MVPFVAMHAGTCFFAAAEEAAEGVSSTNDQHSVQHVATQARLGSALQSDEQQPSCRASTLRKQAAEMLILVASYRELPKSNWGRQDIWAFRQLGK
jgi:hypothetical protein